MSAVQGNVRGTRERRARTMLAVGAFLSIAIWVYALAPIEPAGAASATTGGLSSGTTGTSPGYVVTLLEDTGECWSTGTGAGYAVPYADGDTGLNANTHTVSVMSDGYQGPTPPTDHWGEADCDEPESSFVATFDWQAGTGNLPPPDVLIIKEEIAANAVGVGWPDVDCDMSASYNYTTVTAQCTGVRWHVIQNPGTEPANLELAPTAYAALPQGAEEDPFSATASMTYTVTCYNVRIDYTGVIDESTDPKAMIGHAIRAEVDLGGLSNSGATFAWTVTGNGKFESYSIATDDSSATLDETFPTNQQSVTLAFSKQNLPAGFSCAVNLASPDLAEFTVTSTFGVDVYGPAAGTETMSIAKGDMEITYLGSGTSWIFGPFGLSVTIPNNQGDYGGSAGRTDDTGVKWQAAVNIPSAFTTENASAGTKSMVCFINTLESVFRRRQYNDNSWDNSSKNFLKNPNPPPDRKLDRKSPYQEISLTGEFLADARTQLEIDAPSFNVNSDYKKAEMNDEHEVFLMFRPYSNGVGAFWVPLDAYKWNPNGKASRSGSTWSMDTGHSVGSTHTGTFPNHPRWEAIVTPGW